MSNKCRQRLYSVATSLVTALPDSPTLRLPGSPAPHSSRRPVLNLYTSPVAGSYLTNHKYAQTWGIVDRMPHEAELSRSIQQQAEPTNEKEADSSGLRTLKRK
ncbi:hypothetical protein FOXB_10975 [Fusarium oxysporum f. sp. conglutinans Fo5176]|uniref:Uncharacterized protein n=1 Tax=Fusarium oxysporum (strain Fo5176) TaxID=660025 RepID=F9FX43_FUSOF|nr:hypothetical protein FOXB_10975 [Fusarium oxysporum f. sp. conglutinans Fo5176]